MPDKTVCLSCIRDMWPWVESILYGGEWPCSAKMELGSKYNLKMSDPPPEGCLRLMEQGIAAALESTNAK